MQKIVLSWNSTHSKKNIVNQVNIVGSPLSPQAPGMSLVLWVEVHTNMVEIIIIIIIVVVVVMIGMIHMDNFKMYAKSRNELE